MSNLLERLVEEAATLTDGDLPSVETVRTVLAGLVKHVEALEEKVLGPLAAPVEQVAEAAAADVVQAAEPAATEPPAPAPTAEEIAAAQAVLKAAGVTS